MWDNASAVPGPALAGWLTDRLSAQDSWHHVISRVHGDDDNTGMAGGDDGIRGGQGAALHPIYRIQERRLRQPGCGGAGAPRSSGCRMHGALFGVSRGTVRLAGQQNTPHQCCTRCSGGGGRGHRCMEGMGCMDGPHVVGGGWRGAQQSVAMVRRLLAGSVAGLLVHCPAASEKRPRQL